MLQYQKFPPRKQSVCQIFLSKYYPIYRTGIHVNIILLTFMWHERCDEVTLVLAVDAGQESAILSTFGLSLRPSHGFPHRQEAGVTVFVPVIRTSQGVAS